MQMKSTISLVIIVFITADRLVLFGLNGAVIVWRTFCFLPVVVAILLTSVASTFVAVDPKSCHKEATHQLNIHSEIIKSV